MYQAVLEENGGKITKNEYWAEIAGLSREENRKGHYSLLNIDASHEAHELERRISLNDDIIRHLTLRVDEHEADNPCRCATKPR